MTLTARILAPEEYSKLRGLDAGTFLEHMTSSGVVVVVEADGVIVATQLLQPILHAEGLWIREEFRGRPSVGRKLWRLTQQTIRETFGKRWFVTAAASDDVRKMLESLGARELPPSFIVPVKGA